MPIKKKLSARRIGRARIGARPCPVCECLEAKTIYHQRLSGGPLGEGYDIVVCIQCGAAYARAIPSQSELDRYYAEQSKYNYEHSGGVESPYDFRRFEIIADHLLPNVPSRRARILDIGCGTGGLISVLKKRGYSNALGLDPSPVCAASAGRLHGVKVRIATLAQMAGWRETFDLVLMVGVLEHIRDVRQAVRVVAGRLKKGGLLYCAQPDTLAFHACVNAPFQQFSIEHVNFFSATSLARLMAVCGLEQRRLWRWMTEWREGITDSVVSGLFGIPESLDAQKLEAYGADALFLSRAAPIQPSEALPQSIVHAATAFDNATEPALHTYISKCAENDYNLQQVVEELIASREPLLVWGTGTLTRRLLATTRLAEANIVAFVDSNTRFRGRRLAGRSILSPAQLAGRNEVIAICSMTFEREIKRTIRHELGLKNRLVLLSH